MIFVKHGFLNQIQHMIIPKFTIVVGEHINPFALPSESEFKRRLTSTKPQIIKAKV